MFFKKIINDIINKFPFFSKKNNPIEIKKEEALNVNIPVIKQLKK
jgi:hypothetical protein